MCFHLYGNLQLHAVDSACQKLILWCCVSVYRIVKWTGTPQSNTLEVDTLNICLSSWSTNLCIVLSMSFCRFRPWLSYPSPFIPSCIYLFFCSTQPLRSYNHQHVSESVTAHFSQSIPVMCCVIVFLFSSLAVLILVGVWLFGAGTVGGVVLV